MPRGHVSYAKTDKHNAGILNDQQTSTVNILDELFRTVKAQYEQDENALDEMQTQLENRIKPVNLPLDTTPRTQHAQCYDAWGGGAQKEAFAYMLIALTNQLVMEYLHWYDYQITAKSLATETGLECKVPPRDVLESKVGLFRHRELPIMLELVSRTVRRHQLQQKTDMERQKGGTGGAASQPVGGVIPLVHPFAFSTVGQLEGRKPLSTIDSCKQLSSPYGIRKIEVQKPTVNKSVEWKSASKIEVRKPVQASKSVISRKLTLTKTDGLRPTRKTEVQKSKRKIETWKPASKIEARKTANIKLEGKQAAARKFDKCNLLMDNPTKSLKKSDERKANGKHIDEKPHLFAQKLDLPQQSTGIRPANSKHQPILPNKCAGSGGDGETMLHAPLTKKFPLKKKCIKINTSRTSLGRDERAAYVVDDTQIQKFKSKYKPTNTTCIKDSNKPQYEDHIDSYQMGKFNHINMTSNNTVYTEDYGELLKKFHQANKPKQKQLYSNPNYSILAATGKKFSTAAKGNNESMLYPSMETLEDLNNYDNELQQQARIHLQEIVKVLDVSPNTKTTLNRHDEKPPKSTTALPNTVAEDFDTGNDWESVEDDMCTDDYLDYDDDDQSEETIEDDDDEETETTEDSAAGADNYVPYMPQRKNVEVVEIKEMYKPADDDDDALEDAAALVLKKASSN